MQFGKVISSCSVQSILPLLVKGIELLILEEFQGWKAPHQFVEVGEQLGIYMSFFNLRIQLHNYNILVLIWEQGAQPDFDHISTT